jgi:sugar lactone lactonase YvrE
MRTRASRTVLTALAATVLVGATLATAPAADAAAKPALKKVSPAAGSTAGGTKVTITGSGFAKGVKVKFGTTATKSVKLLSKTKLTVIAPKHKAGAVDIRVTTKSGTSKAVKADKFTYGAAPSVSSTAPSAGPPATTVTIKGTGLTGATAVSFGGVKGSSLKVAKTGKSLTVKTPAHPVGAVDVVVTTKYGSGTKKKAFTYTTASSGGGTGGNTTPTPPALSTVSVLTSGIDLSGAFTTAGVALDSAGNIYYADTVGGYNVVEKIPAAGGASAIVVGSTDGAGTAPSACTSTCGPTSFHLFQPPALAFDPSGNLFVTEAATNVIFKVTAPGTAGSTASLFAGPTVDGATWTEITGIVTDSAGNLYVANMGVTSTVDKVSPAGVISPVTTIVGGTLQGGIAIDKDGNLYVPDTDACVVDKIPAGSTTATPLFGGCSADPSAGVSAENTGGPMSIAVDKFGNVFVGTGYSVVLKYSAGVVATVTGVKNSPGSSTAGAAAGNKVAYVAGLATDSTGNLYVLNAGTGSPPAAGTGSLIKIS